MKKLVYCPECRGLGYKVMTDENRCLAACYSEICCNCKGSGLVEAPLTNYERVLQNMTVEKLGAIFDFVCDNYNGTCEECPVHSFAAWSCNGSVSSYHTLLQEAKD